MIADADIRDTTGNILTPGMAGYEAQLSKWWRTPSCAAAFKRADDKRRERLQKLTETKQRERAEIDAQIWNGDNQ